MSRYPMFQRDFLTLADVTRRESDVPANAIASLGDVSVNSIPQNEPVADAVFCARRDGRPVFMMIGGHPIKLGLSRFLIDLIEKRFLTCQGKVMSQLPVRETCPIVAGRPVRVSLATPRAGSSFQSGRHVMRRLCVVGPAQPMEEFSARELNDDIWSLMSIDQG